MKILLYYHAGSRNHGCEAIVRTICEIFKDDQIVLYSFDSDADKQFGMEELVCLKQCLPRKEQYSIKERIQIRLGMYQEGQECYSEMLEEKSIDWAFAIGGDNYCYKGQPEEMAYINRELKKRNVKTALVGCSIDAEVIKKPSIQTDLALYDIIVARESLTYKALQGVGLINVVLYPDSAFLLKVKDVSVAMLRDDVKYIGINVSPLIVKNETKKNILYKNYLKLIQYILEETEYHILLLPHVCVAWDNDLDVLEELKEDFEGDNRIHMLPEMGCEELKYYVSKCSFVVCARTHISIAAYSLGIPTLVIGYSIKSKGIAKDLFGGYEGYVLAAADIMSEDDITSQFVKLYEDKDGISKRLLDKAGQYKVQLSDLRKCIVSR